MNSTARISEDIRPEHQSQLELLRRFSEIAAGAEDLEEALMDLGLALAEMLPCAVIGVLQLVPDGNNLLLKPLRPVSPKFASLVQEEMIGRYEDLAECELSRKDLRIQIDPACDETGFDKPGEVLLVPIAASGEMQGVLGLASGPGEVFVPEKRQYFQHAAESLSSVLVSIGHMRLLAARDELTGLYNRRGLESEFDRVWQEASHSREALGLIVMDVDRLKSLNDEHGHAVGDEMLCELGRLLDAASRPGDVAARFGGDEMVLILPGAGQGETTDIARQLLDDVRQQVFCEKTEALHVTVSVGAASCVPGTEGESSGQLLRRADQALYLAKQRGRDCVCTWGEADLPELVQC